MNRQVAGGGFGARRDEEARRSRGTKGAKSSLGLRRRPGTGIAVGGRLGRAARVGVREAAGAAVSRLTSPPYQSWRRIACELLGCLPELLFTGRLWQECRGRIGGERHRHTAAKRLPGRVVMVWSPVFGNFRGGYLGELLTNCFDLPPELLFAQQFPAG